MSKEKDIDKKIRDLAEKCTTSAESVLSRKRTILPVSPCVDNLIGGGITTGSLVIFRGPPKVGKTSTILHFAGKAQKAGYTICYLNIEGRLSARDLRVDGLDLSAEKFMLIESNNVGEILSGEDFLGLAEYYLKTMTKLIIVFDSFSQLISQDAKDSDLRERTRDPIHITISRFCKRILPILSITDNICVGVTHDVANQGYGQATKTETSGTKLQYANNYKLYAKWSQLWEEDGVVVGQNINWECENTALGIPHSKGVGKLRYGLGIDEVAELIPLACDSGVILKSGGGNFKYGDFHVRGETKLVAYLRENPDLVKEIYKEVRSRLESPGLSREYLFAEIKEDIEHEQERVTPESETVDP